jgi:hypothetical protein
VLRDAHQGDQEMATTPPVLHEGEDCAEIDGRLRDAAEADAVEPSQLVAGGLAVLRAERISALGAASLRAAGRGPPCRGRERSRARELRGRCASIRGGPGRAGALCCRRPNLRCGAGRWTLRRSADRREAALRGGRRSSARARGRPRRRLPARTTRGTKEGSRARARFRSRCRPRARFRSRSRSCSRSRSRSCARASAEGAAQLPPAADAAPARPAAAARASAWFFAATARARGRAAPPPPQETP